MKDNMKEVFDFLDKSHKETDKILKDLQDNMIRIGLITKEEMGDYYLQ